MPDEPVGVALVLGARNLGGAITRDLLPSGRRVGTVVRTPVELKALEADGAIAIRADASDPDQLRDALERAAGNSGRST